MRSLCFKAKSARSRKFYWTSNPHDCKAELDIDEAMTFPSSAPGGWHFWFLMACLHSCYLDGHVAQPTLFTYLVTRLNCHRCLACVVLNSEGLHRVFTGLPSGCYWKLENILQAKIELDFGHNDSTHPPGAKAKKAFYRPGLLSHWAAHCKCTRKKRAKNNLVYGRWCPVNSL